MFSAAALAALQRDRAELRERAAVGAGDVGHVADRVDARRRPRPSGPGRRRCGRRGRAAAAAAAASDGAMMPPPQTTQCVLIVVPSASVDVAGADLRHRDAEVQAHALAAEHLGGVVVRLVGERRRAARARGRRCGSAPRRPRGRGTRPVIVSWIMSASAPASSTPVGPPPTTTKFSAPSIDQLGSRSASSNTPRIRVRSRCASSSE